MSEGQGGKLGRVRRWSVLTLDLEEMNDFFFLKKTNQRLKAMNSP